ncbi:Coenzyme Q (ubiquinone) biosynthesis protein Coq4 [Nannocystis exedens]|uniref:Coenzyme Q (Ubiquinone) biosynthesis protein Coq4 n=1 Tax=Nannocystis exedens TaxID=54 RepID=A0A1I2IG72_9BACT|nr:Coq4 family protein [Nannocystis exedens]PCC67197.1 Coenzyme Q (ubiquinone) biosynthesis protein Coq4 [Nannocystis exedens]SFF41315.1 Coenzyme Q (ubiquinone) biosynthesis protein Coq4 [Nannocystis exedens]
MKWSEMRELSRMQREGRPLGDIAALKFAYLAGPKHTGNDRLHTLPAPCLEVDLAALRALPEGTVGRAFAHQLDRNNLEPLVISDEMKRRLADNPLALRYTTTHDLVHVLTGFPTTPAGEIGVFAFMIGQGFGSSSAMLWLSTVIYSLLMPLHIPGVWHNVRVGLRMAKEAEPMLEARLEDLLPVPLTEARRRLGVRPETVAAIAPGHESWLANRLLAKPPAKAMA